MAIKWPPADHLIPAKPPYNPEPNAREMLARNARAEALADVIAAYGIPAVNVAKAGDTAWQKFSDCAARLMPDFAPGYLPSDQTRRLVLIKLTRRELLARELKR